MMEMAWDACHPTTSICLNGNSGFLSLFVSPSEYGTSNGNSFLFYFYIGVIYLFGNGVYIVDCLALFCQRLFSGGIKMGEIESRDFSFWKIVRK